MDLEAGADGVISAGGSGSSGIGDSEPATETTAGSDGVSDDGETDDPSDGGVATGGPKFDLGDDDTGRPPTEEEGCTKVDFLFVIDNSPSMGDQQAALIEAFPGFMQTIEETLQPGTDFHVMVVDTDAEDRCVDDTCPETHCAAADYYACSDSFDQCDSTLGAGVINPAGNGATNAVCELAGGGRFISGEEPDLAAAFACVAQVGLAGAAAERPMDSMTSAVGSAMGDAGACNDGFLRDDAILVVTFISDDPRWEDEGQPEDWFNQVRDAKGGSAEAIVMMGLIPGLAEGCGNANDPEWPNGSHWLQFVDMFGERGSTASVCAFDQFTGFFEAGVSIIEQTCNDFEPPG